VFFLYIQNACFLSLRVADDDDHRVTSDEHLRDISLSVAGVRPLPLVRLGGLSPHLTHVFQHHVHVAVECLHAAEDFTIVAAVEEDLGVGLHGLGEEGEGALVEGVFLGDVLFLLVCHCERIYIIFKTIYYKENI
jgi:hypothetical protein